MFLSDRSIKLALASKEIEIFPQVSQKNIRPAGIRIRLSKYFFIPKRGMLYDSKNPFALNEYFEEKIIEDSLTLSPGDFVLAYSKERLKTSNRILVFLDGRSTLARVGLTIHQSACVIDNVHSDARHIMLELRNEGAFNIRLNPNDSIGMLLFSELSDIIEQKAQVQYADQGKDNKLPEGAYQLRLCDIDT